MFGEIVNKLGYHMHAKTGRAMSEAPPFHDSMLSQVLQNAEALAEDGRQKTGALEFPQHRHEDMEASNLQLWHEDAVKSGLAVGPQHSLQED